jgi:Neuraminidase (sialidase)
MILGLLFTFCANKNKKEIIISEPETVLRILSSENNPRNSEGDFIELKNGKILFVYSHYTGDSRSDHAPAFLAGRYSSDGGNTWTTEDEVIIENEGTMNVMSVTLLRLQNDDIALFYLRKNSMSDCTPLMRISKDEAKSWSDPVQCISDKKGYFVVNNDRVIQLKNGRILMPVSLHKTEDSEYSNSGRLWCYYSDNNGLTWQVSEEILKADTVITQEPGIIELNNGDIMMLIRANGGIQYQSFSKDKGETWSFAEPSKINSPLSPASIARNPKTKDLVLVWNNNGEKGPGYFKGKRNPLTIAISKDEGKTWQNIRNIEDNPDVAFCYTAIHFTDDHILLGYGVWEKYVGQYITKVDYKWLYQ